MDNLQGIHIGDKVVILHPSHIAGKTGFIYAREMFSDEQVSKRWIIRIDSEDVIVSLNPKEFELLAEL